VLWEFELGGHFPARYLLVGGLWVSVRRGAHAQRRVVLSANGIAADGRRQLLDYRQAAAESSAEWGRFLTLLVGRGLDPDAIYLVAADGADNHPDPAASLARARSIAAELEANHPDAAASLREGLADMFTVRRLGIDGRLARSLTNTNAIESLISVARTTMANVKRWRDGRMKKRWLAAGMIEAERSFRRLKGRRRMPQLVAALRQATAVMPTDYDEEAA
jgi:transposase-like protein